MSQEPKGDCPVAVIVNHGSPDMTVAVVQQLFAGDPMVRDGAIKLVVVDCGSSEDNFSDLATQLSSFEQVSVYQFPSRVDYSHVCNWVWRSHPHAPYYFFLNNDLIIPTPALSRMMEIAKYDPKIGILTPLMNTHGPGQNLNSFIKDYPTLPAWTVDIPKPTIKEVLRIDNALQAQVSSGTIPPYTITDYTIAFSCVMIKREVLDTLGGQDEMFPYGLGADDDLCHRAARCGWEVVTVMGTFVGHIGGASLNALGGRDIRKQTTELIRKRWPSPSDQLISVIVPTYNCGRYLWGCLTSLLRQTHVDREIIVVDDGSSDETTEVLRHFNVIKVTSQHNEGAAAARNKGFRVSGGRFVVFCDADAVYKPTFLEELYDVLVDSPKDIAYAYCDLRVTGRREGTHYSGEWAEGKLLAQNFICCPTLIKREYFTGFDPNLHRLQDWDLWLGMWLNHSLRGMYVSKTLYTSIERPEGISGGGSAGLIMAGEVVREKYGI